MLNKEKLGKARRCWLLFTTLTDAQEQDLLAGNLYFNVHTAKNPGGEIRGQIEQVK